MFFVISKIVGFFINSYNLVFISVIIYLIFAKRKSRFLKFISNSFGIIAILVIIIGGFKAIPNYLIWNFENIISNEILDSPDGIILLGGSFSGSQKSIDENQVGLNGRSERVIETLRLLNKHQQASLLFVSDSAVLTSARISEAEQANKFFKIFGIDPKRLIIKKVSNNTYQESEAIAQYLKLNGGDWIIVTSAMHMVRTLALMQSRDIGSAKIYPYLTDFQGSNPKFSLKFSFGNLGRLNSLIHELVGIVVYRITGRTNSFFPNLENIPINQP
ncbi:MAG: YdcF family protein [Candidatus Puniceispirillales bacterium]